MRPADARLHLSLGTAGLRAARRAHGYAADGGGLLAAVDEPRRAAGGQPAAARRADRLAVSAGGAAPRRETPDVALRAGGPRARPDTLHLPGGLRRAAGLRRTDGLSGDLGARDAPPDVAGADRLLAGRRSGLSAAWCRAGPRRGRLSARAADRHPAAGTARRRPRPAARCDAENAPDVDDAGRSAVAVQRRKPTGVRPSAGGDLPDRRCDLPVDRPPDPGRAEPADSAPVRWEGRSPAAGLRTGGALAGDRGDPQRRHRLAARLPAGQPGLTGHVSGGGGGV